MNEIAPLLTVHGVGSHTALPTFTVRTMGSLQKQCLASRGRPSLTVCSETEDVQLTFLHEHRIMLSGKHSAKRELTDHPTRHAHKETEAGVA